MFGFNFGVCGVAGGSGGTSWIAWNGSNDGSNQASIVSTDQGLNIVALDASNFIEFYYLDSSRTLKAIIGTISGTTVTYGSAATITTNLSDSIVSAVLLDTNLVLVTWSDNSANTLKACTVSTGTGTPSANAIITVDSNNPSNLGNCNQLARISSTSAFLCYRGGSAADIVGRILSVSGTTVTANASTVLTTAVTTPVCAYYDTNKVVVSFAAISTNYPTAMIVNISGTSIGTLGSLQTIVSNAQVSAAQMRAVAISSSMALVTYRVLNGGSGHNDFNAVILSLSGNTVSVNSSTAFGAQDSTIAQLVLLNSTQAMVSYLDSVTPSTKSLILSWIGTTITANTPVSIQTSTDSVPQYGSANIAQMNASTVINGAHLNSTNKNNCKVLKP